MKKLIIFALVLLFVSACAKPKLTQHESAKADYELAKQMIDNGGYDEGDLFLERFIVKYPYSDYATSAEMLRIYATYKGERLELTQVLAERFKSRHPRHPNIAYAQYMLAMSYYKKRAEMHREQAPTLKAMAEFEDLIKKFPQSSYSKEAMPRLQMLKNLLAGHELSVGKFYFKQRRYVAAGKRFQVVLDRYQQSPVIEESLYYLAASYAALKMKKNAHEIAVLLHHNYPKGDWSEKVSVFL
ncbi:MAG: outer membrane protein assembly factor BamD [Mariprofundaceae bacterium]|nr:outer membrane protein assembly factor BamD [Mariprofundaceae bacterium]